MKSNLRVSLALVAVISFCTTSANAALLFKDNFDVADSGSFDAASTAGRLSGPVGAETILQSFGAQQAISGNNLQLVGAGGVRFGNETARYNWAGATTGPAILAAGGFQVSFDWTHNAGSPEWVALKVGTPNGDSGVNAGTVDHAVLIRQNENIVGQWTERWDNGAATGGMISYSPIPNINTYPVVLSYSFNSFADGSPVNLSAVVNGIEVANDNFTWDGNGGALHFELATGVAQLVDNYTVSTLPARIPEPSTIALVALAGVALLARRGR